MDNFIKWLPEYSLGIEEIDKQHKEFVNIMNNLYDVTNSEIADDKKLKNILNQLLVYSEYHFATEEKYFDLYNYKYSKVHKKIHKKLIDSIKNFPITDYPSLREAGQALFEFLEKWLVGHLIFEDRKYVDCFKENGL